MAYHPLDIYNAMCDAENGFDSGAMDRLCGTDSYGGLSSDDDYDDDLYTPEELRAMGMLRDEDDD